MKILIIDDEQSAFETLKLLLAGNPDLEFEYRWAERFDSGIEIIDEWSPDVCLLDLNLGVESLADRTMARIPSIARKTAVIAITALEDRGNFLWAKCIENGAVNFLQKSHYFNPDPLTRKSLMHAIFNSAKVWKEYERRMHEPAQVS